MLLLSFKMNNVQVFPKIMEVSGQNIAHKIFRSNLQLSIMKYCKLKSLFFSGHSGLKMK